MLLAAMLIVAWETPAASSDPIAWLVNLGVAGIVIVLLVTGQLRTKSEVTHLLDELGRKDEMIADRDRVIAGVQSQLLNTTVPALAQSARIVEAVPATEQALIDQLQAAQAEAVDLIGRLERLERRGDRL